MLDEPHTVTQEQLYELVLASESVTATNPDYVRTIKSTVAKEIDGKIAIVDVYVFEEEYAGKSRIFL